MKDDVIRRQEALDAISNIDLQIYEGNCAVGRRYYMTQEEVCSIINSLPPAQPEIIRCKECKYWTNNIGDSELRDNYCNEIAHGFYYRCNGDDFCSRAERRKHG